MQIFPIKTGIIRPPQDDLLLKIKQSKLRLREHDVVIVTSKVVSIWQGRCVSQKLVKDKDFLAKKEATFYLERSAVPGRHRFHTITENILIGSAGIDASNANGYFILWPEHPMKTAEVLLAWLKKTYRKKHLYLVMTDSHSVPLRRGTIGFALAWAGFKPLYDYRKQKDLFGRPLKVTQANIPDALAAAAVLVIGEAREQTPVAVIRGAPHVQELTTKNLQLKTNRTSFVVPMKEDIFAPFLLGVKWKKGKKMAR